MSCHSSWSEYALAFQPEQLNRPGPDGRNQLVALTEAGLIRRAGKDDEPLPPFDADSAAKEPKLADPADEGQPLEVRARSYLHANCGHCHCEGGGGAVDLRLQFPVDAAEMKAVGVRPARGDFGLPEACIIKPGDPYASTLYFRMAKFGRDRMPHIGSERPDEAGLKLIGDWIAGMGGAAAKPDPLPDGGPPDRLLTDPRSALAAARRARARRDETRRTGSLAGGGGQAPGRPDPRSVRGLPAHGRDGAAQARLEPSAAGHSGPERGRRPRRGAVLVAGGQLRQVPQDRATGARRSGRS